MLKPISKETTDRFCALVIGNAGVGKTSLIRTIPEGKKALVLSAESGLLAIRDLINADLVEGFEIGSFADLKEAYQMCLSPDFKNRYSYIFIDSLTEISSRCVEAMKAKHTKSEDSFKMWGEFQDLMNMIIKGFRDLTSYSVVFTCLPSIQTDELNRRFVGAAIAGKQLQERLSSYFDLVLYMVTKEDAEGNEYRCFLTSNNDKCPGKDRSGKLLPIEQPNLTVIHDKILNQTQKGE